MVGYRGVGWLQGVGGYPHLNINIIVINFYLNKSIMSINYCNVVGYRGGGRLQRVGGYPHPNINIIVTNFYPK